MQSRQLSTPVVLCVFNRPETTRRVFEAIARAQPSRLLIVADGPRSNRPGDARLCAEVREIVEQVDWPCEVSRDYAETNIGCDPRVLSGLDWAFSLVEEAIILEDDCLPDATFFPFCEQLLARYRGDQRIAAISGTNLVKQTPPSQASYSFSFLGGNWGWATWRERWQTFDRSLASWPAVKETGMLRELFQDKRTAARYAKIFDSLNQSAQVIPWDYLWLYFRLTQGMLSIIPRLNSIANIGMIANATHPVNLPARVRPPSHSITFPLIEPVSMIASRSMDTAFERATSMTFLEGLLRKAGALRNKLLRDT